jgi:hypothetical protein
MTQLCTERNCHPVAITRCALRPLQTLLQHRQFLMYLLRGFIQTHLGQQLHHNLVRLSSGVQIAAGSLPNRLHRSIQVPVGYADLRSHEARCVRMIHGLAYLRCNTCHFPRTSVPLPFVKMRTNVPSHIAPFVVNSFTALGFRDAINTRKRDACAGTDFIQASFRQAAADHPISGS